MLLECKDYVQFLGVLIDKNLTWRPHIDHIASKISKIVGIIARLRHHVPLNTLLQIYRSLIFPYTLYGIPAWGQASQCDLKKILTLQKRALRPIFFAIKRSHVIPLFVASNILPVNSGAPAARRAAKRSPIHNMHGKEKEIHELIFSWLSWLGGLLVGAYARRRRRSCPTCRPYIFKHK